MNQLESCRNQIDVKLLQLLTEAANDQNKELALQLVGTIPPEHKYYGFALDLAKQLNDKVDTNK